MCRISPLATAPFEQPESTEQGEHGINELGFSPSGNQTIAEFAQDRAIESGIGQLEAERELPINAQRTASAAW
jgi:hypothetical protein